MNKVIHIFRRDLRLADNTALNEALRQNALVLPVFIVDEKLLERWRGSKARLAFYYQSVLALQEAVAATGGSLHVVLGDPAQILADLLAGDDFQAVYVNREYSPLGVRRDEALAEVCDQAGVQFHAPDDALLNPPATVLKADGLPYTVFTPYFRKAAMLPVSEPLAPGEYRWFRGTQTSLSDLEEIRRYLEYSLIETVPGREGAEQAMRRASNLGEYSELRDVPAADYTSRLSAHLRFGTCSPREVYRQVAQHLGRDHPLIRQLYWRDFYVQVGWHFPHVFGHAFRRQYENIPWHHSEELFTQWTEGRTGFPIVDAGMRELSQTGFMHNRVRMVTASFLTKNLHIDWRAGEQWFARHLIDYDPAVNNGNWQWSASTGCDAQPYFRVFNPWRQQHKFDRDCVYIKRWVPELEPYPPAAIHGIEKDPAIYLPPMVDLRGSSEKIKAIFKAAAV